MESILETLGQVAPHASWTLEMGDEKKLVESLEWLRKSKKG